MLRLLGSLYSLGIWGTFGLLVYLHWNQCIGIGGCVIGLGVDFLLSVVWPFFWSGWIH